MAHGPSSPGARLAFLALGLVSLLLAAQPARARCAMTRGWRTVSADGVTLRARPVGAGPPLLMLPSLARGPADFDALAAEVKGRTVVLFEPRWFGDSDGPEEASLFDLADDASRVLAALCPGEAADVIGHALGNRIARTFAARHPGQVRRLLLFAAGGQAPIPPAVLAALSGSIAQGEKPDSERLADIRLAFFAGGHDPAVWLSGWVARCGRLQQAALARTPSSDWQTAGDAEILVVQAAEDPVAPIENALAIQARAPDRVKIVHLAHASHAMLPEQPAALAALTNAFLAGESDQAKLQAIVDAATVG